MARMERTVIVVGFAARKGNGSGVNEICLVHLLASDSRNSSRSAKNLLSEPSGGKGPSGCGVGRYRCPSPRPVNLAWKHRQIHHSVFSLSLPFPPRPRGWVFGDGFRDRNPSPNPVLSW
jgi:hypothetical protein